MDASDRKRGVHYMDNKDNYTLELLKELKMQSKRWFIAFIVVLVVFGAVSITSTIARMRMDYRLDNIEQELTEHRSASGTYFEMITEYISESTE